MDARFSQLPSQEAKDLFNILDGQKLVLWIWEKGAHLKKIPVNATIKKDFSIHSQDDLIPATFRRASLLGTFEHKGFYYFLKLLSRDQNGDVQFLCDPILFKNERRKRRRFQISKNAKDFQIIIPLSEPPPVVQNQGNLVNLFPIRLFKNFLSHLSSISIGNPLFHISYSLFDISTSGLSILTDDVEKQFIESLKVIPSCYVLLNKDKFEIKQLELVHSSRINETQWRLGFKFVADDWTIKKIQLLLEQERENVVKEFDQWSK
jgi:hypothetical protein